MKDKLIALTPDEILKLSSSHEILTFKNDFDLVYEGQIPNAGILLIEGHIEIVRKDKIHQYVNPGHLLGLTYLINGTPVKYGCRVKANSQIILLGKSEVLAYVDNKKSKLFPIFNSAR